MTDDADGTDPDDGRAGLSPADAFSVVGNEHRVEILRALLALNRDPAAAYPASFSALRERAGMAVSAQFSYHLGELTEHFVRKTDDGYEFRYAGWKVATALLAGTYNERTTIPAFDVEGSCPTCGDAGLAASYREEWVAVACDACGTRLVRYPFPPGTAAARSRESLLSAFDARLRAHVALTREGVCPECSGRATTGPCGADDLRIDCRCRDCGNQLRWHAGAAVVDDPVAAAACRDAGLDVAAVPFWELPCCVTGRWTERRSGTPAAWTVAVDAPAGVVSVAVDEAFRVTGVESE